MYSLCKDAITMCPRTKVPGRWVPWTLQDTGQSWFKLPLDSIPSPAKKGYRQESDPRSPLDDSLCIFVYTMPCLLVPMHCAHVRYTLSPLISSFHALCRLCYPNLKGVDYRDTMRLWLADDSILSSMSHINSGCSARRPSPPSICQSADHIHTHGHTGKFFVTLLDDLPSHWSLTFSMASFNLTVLLSPYWALGNPQLKNS